MQFIVDVFVALVLTLTSAAFAHFGIEFERPEQRRPAAERTVERTDASAGAQDAAALSDDCVEQQA